MTLEQTTEVIHRLFFDLWIKGDLSLVDKLIAPDYALHNSLLPSNREGLKQSVILMRDTFPAYRGEIHDTIATEDRGMARWTRYCIHRGEFMGVEPTSYEVTLRGVSIYRFAGFKVVEEWVEFDMFSLLRQIGAILPVW